MKVTDLNKSILLEVELKQLQTAYEDAKKELKHDIDYKIILEKLKDFIVKNMNFVKKFDITKQRITVIEQTAKKVISFVEQRLEMLRKVAQIPSEELKPLEDFLEEYKSDVKIHTEIQTEKYKRDAARR